MNELVGLLFRKYEGFVPIIEALTTDYIVFNKLTALYVYSLTLQCTKAMLDIEDFGLFRYIEFVLHSFALIGWLLL